MPNNNPFKLCSILILVGLFFPLVVILAQAGSAEIPSETPATTTPETETAQTVATSSAPTIEPQATLATTTIETSRPEIFEPTSPIPITTPAPINQNLLTTSTSIQNTETTPFSNAPLLITSIILVILAVLSLWYLRTQSYKKKKVEGSEENNSRCFDIKKLLDQKLEELTDLKGFLEGKAEDKVREKIRETVQDTSAGEILTLIETAEKEYNRLKKLYEECLVEFEENSIKTLKFRPNLVEQILLGEKSSTWRLFDDKDLKEGDQLTLINKETLKEFGTAVITSLKIKTLSTLTETDWEGHERFSSDEEMYAKYREYYGEKVNPNSEVKIISFDFKPKI